MTTPDRHLADTAPGPSSDRPGLPLSVVVPMFNEAASLPALAEAIRRWFDPATTQFVFVDDGSTDTTAEVADGIAAGLPHAVVVRLALNAGKGAAVRAGVAEATGALVMFMDADLAVDLGCLDELLSALDGVDVAIGSRSLDGASAVGSTPLRVLMGRTFSLIGRVVGRTGVRDSQCGFKSFRSEAATILFGLSRVDGFAFDAEVLRLARQLDFRVVEIPVVWVAQPGSNVRPVRDSTRALFDTLVMRVRTGRRHTRRRATELGWAPRPHTRPSPGPGDVVDSDLARPGVDPGVGRDVSAGAPLRSPVRGPSPSAQG